MSGIVLSNAVRQNLSSLQATADLLATTQSRLASGKKVNSALDNPTNFFTASSLDARASDINNLLDGIGNGVQILQAANTGITSLNKLVDSAKSIANQALQTVAGYATKSNVSTTITGATADDLRGTTTYTSTAALSNVLYSGKTGGADPAVGGTTLGGIAGTFTGGDITENGTAALITVSTKLNNTTGALGTATVADGDSFTVNGKTITFKAVALPTTAPAGTTLSGNIAVDAGGNSTIYIGAITSSTATVGDVLNAINLASGVAYVNNTGTVTQNTGQTLSHLATGSGTTNSTMVLQSSTGADLTLSGKADLLAKFGLTGSSGAGTVTVTANRTTAGPTPAPTPGTMGTLIQDGSVLNVDGKTITFKNAPTPTASATHTGITGNVETDGSGNSTVYLQTGTIADVLTAIDLATGVQTATLSATGAGLKTAVGATNSSINASGALAISTGTSFDLTITGGAGNAMSVLGLNGNTGTDTSFTAARTASAGNVSGKTLTFTSFNGGTAVNVTFGDGTSGTVKTLAQLNSALAANNMVASVDNATGKLTISASNDYASHTLGGSDGGAIGGTLSTTLSFSPPSAPVADAGAQTTRASFVKQFNDIMDQITTTAQDSSFNGVNLLNGDTLKLVFNETGKSTIQIQGVTYNPTGLGLSSLTAGTDFIDNNATNKVLAKLNTASTTLRAQASAFGSNLSIVQARQDFSKSLINVLQTGSSNLTLADTNEEAANSQALTTRQSIAVSALSLANQSQQSVLQLLR